MQQTSQPSLPGVRKLRFELPKGATDTHFHVFGPADRFPFIRDRDFTPDDALPPVAECLFAAVGIERAVLVQPSVYGNDNSRHLSASAEMGSPTRVVVAAEVDCPEADIARFHEQGARGIRIIVAKQGWPRSDELVQLTRRLSARGWHLQLLVKPDQIVELEDRIASFACPVVIDHLGMIDPRSGLDQPALKALLRLLDGGRCWVKISGYYRLSRSGAPYRDLTEVVTALVNAAPDRMLWGSDWPHPFFNGPIPELADVIDPLFDWIPDEIVRRKILVDNPARLFGFEDGLEASSQGANAHA